ncbi:MAG: lipid-binding SYLF domain-containing protein [Desulfomonilaceae bacterium]
MMHFKIVLASLLFSFMAFQSASGQSLELENRLSQCIAMFTDMMTAPDSAVPKDLLKRSRAVILFPSVIKAGMGVGGQYGKGVVMRRDPQDGGWSPPVFLTLYGGSFGWQFGVQSVDLLLLVLNDVSLKNLFRDKFTIGADASIAAGPIGRDASAQTDFQLNAAILSYSRAKGLYIGISVKGAVLEPDWEANELYYGSDLSIVDIFCKKVGQVSPKGEALMRLLQKYSS